MRRVRGRCVRLEGQGRATARDGRGREGGTWTRKRRVRHGATRRRREGVRCVREQGGRCVRERRKRAVRQVTQARRGRRARDLVMEHGLGAGVWEGECVHGRDAPAGPTRPPWREDLG